MEQARLFLAIALSILVFVLWQFFFVDKQQIQQQGEAPQTAIESGEKKSEPMETVKPRIAEKPAPVYDEPVPATILMYMVTLQSMTCDAHSSTEVDRQAHNHGLQRSAPRPLRVDR